MPPNPAPGVAFGRLTAPQLARLEAMAVRLAGDRDVVPKLLADAQAELSADPAAPALSEQALEDLVFALVRKHARRAAAERPPVERPPIEPRVVPAPAVARHGGVLPAPPPAAAPRPELRADPPASQTRPRWRRAAAAAGTLAVLSAALLLVGLTVPTAPRTPVSTTAPLPERPIASVEASIAAGAPAERQLAPLRAPDIAARTDGAARIADPLVSLIAAAEPPERRLFVHHLPGAADATRATALAAALARRGFTVAALREVRVAPAEPQLRYFFAADRPVGHEVAAAAAAALGPELGDGRIELRDFTGYEPRPRPGTLEIWLPPDG